MKTLNPNRSWILAIGLILAGCQTPKPSLPELGARFEPKNVYRAVDALPGNLQRVVLMPVTLSTPDLATLDHRNQLAKILEEELRKTHRFEVIKATPDGKILQEWSLPQNTGKYPKPDEYRPSWTLHLPNGEFFVLDGYGRDYILNYGADGEFKKVFGGAEGGIVHWGPHGGMIEAPRSGEPTLLIAMSDQQHLLRMSTDGRALGTIP